MFSLTRDAYLDPSATLGRQANRLGVSQRQVRGEARREIDDWLALAGEPADRFDDALGLA